MPPSSDTADDEGAPSDGPQGCPRCGHDEVRTGRTSTGAEQAAADVGRVDRYATVTCERCGYTDLYDVKGDGSPVDLFFGYDYVPTDERPRATMRSAGDRFHCDSCGTAFADGEADECPECGREFV